MQYTFGLIGYPLGHSLSPWIHGEFLEEAGLKGTYEKYEIEPEADFGKEIEKLKQSGIDGFNITVPYKETIIPYLDELDDQARKMGAVNTVHIQNGRMKGYNTDGTGYVRSLETAYPELAEDKNKRILLLGAGGAARGIYYALAAAGFKQVDLANRTASSAENIKALAGRTATEVLTLEEAEANTAEYDVIIQTTSVGMAPKQDVSIIRMDRLKSGAIASDIVYKPLQTAFLSEARQHGARIHYGHTMLLYQAQYAFEIWTGKPVSAAELDEKLKKILEGAS